MLDLHEPTALEAELVPAAVHHVGVDGAEVAVVDRVHVHFLHVLLAEGLLRHVFHVVDVLHAAHLVVGDVDELQIVVGVVEPVAGGMDDVAGLGSDVHIHEAVLVDVVEVLPVAGLVQEIGDLPILQIIVQLLHSLALGVPALGGPAVGGGQEAAIHQRDLIHGHIPLGGLLGAALDEVLLRHQVHYFFAVADIRLEANRLLHAVLILVDLDAMKGVHGVAQGDPAAVAELEGEELIDPIPGPIPAAAPVLRPFAQGGAQVFRHLLGVLLLVDGRGGREPGVVRDEQVQILLREHTGEAVALAGEPQHVLPIARLVHVPGDGGVGEVVVLPAHVEQQVVDVLGLLPGGLRQGVVHLVPLLPGLGLVGVDLGDAGEDVLVLPLRVQNVLGHQLRGHDRGLGRGGRTVRLGGHGAGRSLRLSKGGADHDVLHLIPFKESEPAPEGDPQHQHGQEGGDQYFIFHPEESHVRFAPFSS